MFFFEVTDDLNIPYSVFVLFLRPKMFNHGLISTGILVTNLFYSAGYIKIARENISKNKKEHYY